VAIDRLVGLLMPLLEKTIRASFPSPIPWEYTLAAAEAGLREVLFGQRIDGAAVVSTPEAMLHHVRCKAASTVAVGMDGSTNGRSEGETWVENLLPDDPLGPQIGAVLDAEATLRFAVEDRLNAVHTLVEANMRWVHGVARSMAGRGIDKLDLMQEGAKALQKAAMTFRLAENVCFLAYAGPAVKRALLDKTRVSAGLSDHASREVGKFKLAKDELRQSLSREPSNEEVLDFLDWSPTKRRNVESALRITKRQETLRPPGEGGEEPSRGAQWEVLTGLIRDSDALNRDSDAHCIKAVMDQLPSPEQEIITGVFFLGQSESVIGRELHLSKEEVAKHKEHGLEKIEAALSISRQKRRPR
jgi:RNA polymerase primary sigma factor